MMDLISVLDDTFLSISYSLCVFIFVQYDMFKLAPIKSSCAGEKSQPSYCNLFELREFPSFSNIAHFK